MIFASFSYDPVLPKFLLLVKAQRQMRNFSNTVVVEELLQTDDSKKVVFYYYT